MKTRRVLLFSERGLGRDPGQNSGEVSKGRCEPASLLP